MKRRNKKLLTTMLAGVLCAATVGGVSTLRNITANAAELADGEYKLSDVFATSYATLGANDEKFATFTFEKDGNVNLKRDLAFTWKEDAESTKYLEMTFGFANSNFEEVKLTFESTSAWATEDDKASNVITFTKKGSGVSVKVNDGSEQSVSNYGEMKLAFVADTDDGEFGVTLNGSNIGTFVNVGQNCSKYSYDKMNPFKVDVKMPEAQEGAEKPSFAFTVKAINGQSFEVAKNEEDYIVKDTVAPVLVVNETFGGFLLGTKLSIDYEVVDVLQRTGVTSETLYYQWKPEVEVTADSYKKITSSDLLFVETPYKKDGKDTTIFAEEGKEYVSLKISLDDKGSAEKKEYDLSWHASNTEKKDDINYIILDRSKNGPTYSTSHEQELTKFQETVQAKAKELRHGSGQKLSLPSVKWLLNDDNGFRNLKFTIVYKTPVSETGSSANLAYNKLEIPVEYIGEYQFKIFAIDKAGNKMMHEGEEITTENIWDIDSIPTFEFEIGYHGIQITEKTIKDKETVGDTYTLGSFTVLGARKVGTTKILYRLDEDKAKEIKLTETTLTSVNYSDLQLDKNLKNQDDYYLTAYKNKLAQKLGIADDKAKLAILDECFIKVEEFDDRIDKEKHEAEWKASDNKYNWKASNGSFTVAESGTYLMFADCKETDEGALVASDEKITRAAAYKVIVAETEADVYKEGTDFGDWVKNNVVSVVLFAIAGVMLILIIILLFTKPADETLEDVDEKAKADKKDEEKK